mmetsp:Transcript_64698/g.145350  ORF Transcript_64698/g.145350 Transcript_64698/m.145350 type:complete len:251 (-) Transcript_64698:106-858(-)
MYGAKIGFSSARLRCSCSGSLPCGHGSEAPARVTESATSSSKGSSSSAVAPKCCAKAAYQKSKPHLARSVWRNAVKCVATSARSASGPANSRGLSAEMPAMPSAAAATAATASATARRVKRPPNSPTKRPRMDMRVTSSEAGSIHLSKCACASGNNCRLPAMTASTTNNKIARACGVVWFVNACTSLSRSAQALQSSVGAAATLLTVWAACLTKGCACTAPWITTSAQKEPEPPPDTRFWARSAGLACCN